MVVYERELWVILGCFLLESEHPGAEAPRLGLWDCGGVIVRPCGRRFAASASFLTERLIAQTSLTPR